MADAEAYQYETTTDRYLLEDGLGVYLLESAPALANALIVIRTITSD